MKTHRFWFASVCLTVLVLHTSLFGSFVQARLWGRLGNHLFIIAAASSLAWEHGAMPVFPDLEEAKHLPDDPNSNYNPKSLRTNYEKIFKHLKAKKPAEQISYTYREKSFTYSPIPYQPNMLLEGWFQSEKYFIKHKKKIIELFAPPVEIVNYLTTKYAAELSHPNTVSVHLRCYHKENPRFDNVYPTYGRDYVEKAMAHFGDDALFLVFSDKIEWAKKQLAGIPRNIRFIENEPDYHDFYLMSMCKHNIICNSSFSWWAAYLNKNPNKLVIVPPQWFAPQYNHDSSDLIPPDWHILHD